MDCSFFVRSPAHRMSNVAVDRWRAMLSDKRDITVRRAYGAPRQF